MKRFCDRYRVGYNDTLSSEFMVKMAQHLNIRIPDAEQDKRNVLQGIRNKYYALVLYPEDVLKLVMYVCFDVAEIPTLDRKQLSDYGVQNKPLIPQNVLNLGTLPPLGKHPQLCRRFFAEYFGAASKAVPDEATRNVMIAKYRLRLFLIDWLTKSFNELHLNVDDSLRKKIEEGYFEKGRFNIQQETTQDKKKAKKQKQKKIVVSFQQAADDICSEVYFAVAESSTCMRGESCMLLAIAVLLLAIAVFAHTYIV